MHNILDFPNEILHRIIHFLSPNDFESLILSNKTIYDLTGPAPRRHFKLKKRYEVLELSVDSPASREPRSLVGDNRHLGQTVIQNLLSMLSLFPNFEKSFHWTTTRIVAKTCGAMLRSSCCHRSAVSEHAIFTAAAFHGPPTFHYIHRP